LRTGSGEFEGKKVTNPRVNLLKGRGEEKVN